MKTTLPPTIPEAFLNDPDVREYFGSTFKLRAAVLAGLLAGNSASAIARQSGCSRQAIAKHFRRAKQLMLRADQSS